MKDNQIPTPEQALPGRTEKIAAAKAHCVFQKPLFFAEQELLEKGYSRVLFGMGCFWGAERKYWQLGDASGVISTSVGYSAGLTPNPTYQEVCSGMTGHNEVVQVIYDPSRIDFQELLSVFWLNHNPTQGMRQGNDIGTQYRSGIYTFNPEQQASAEQSRKTFQEKLIQAGINEPITTEILPATEFYFAEDYHQQYLHKNPNGYCGLGGLGINF